MHENPVGEAGVPEVWRTYYEPRRLLIRSTCGAVCESDAPMESVLRDAIRDSIANAPDVRQRNQPEYENHALIFRMSEYERIFPVLPSVLLDEIVAFSLINWPKRAFRADWVALADPQLSELSFSLGEAVMPGESFFEHEGAHVAAMRTQQAGYWVLNFFHYGRPDCKQVYLAYMQFHSWSNDYLEQIRMALAPRYPSGTDYESARQTLTHLGSWVHEAPPRQRPKRLETEQKILKTYLSIMTEKPAFEGRLFTSEAMVHCILPAWQEARRGAFDVSCFAPIAV